MTDLERFRDHCRAMTQPGAHRDTCHAVTGTRWSHIPSRVHPDPACAGCVPDADRALFTRLADETDAYLARNTDQQLDLGGPA